MSAKYYDTTTSTWKNVSVQGPKGDTGSQGPAGSAVPASQVMGVVQHGSDASVDRPAGFIAVYWIGSVKPTNMAAYDLWYQT